MIPVSYMSLATSLIDGGKSFEVLYLSINFITAKSFRPLIQEVRIDDYIQAYMATGKPPQPVTQFSDGDKGQSTLGLPPIFKPTSEHDPILANRPKETAPPLAAQPVTANGPPKKDLTDIPAVQEFKGERVGNETFYTISCAEQFSGYSPEVRPYARHSFPPSPSHLILTPSTGKLYFFSH